ncbi:hypothetical protein PSDT_1049 [Parascardovia denticolens DSM 10105 = JCM 12538]|nr:hypothetical protein PSDT_1049 [Parascardovia denticolens DSM 10105 = JCM 12538]
MIRPAKDLVKLIFMINLGVLRKIVFIKLPFSYPEENGRDIDGESHRQ